MKSRLINDCKSILMMRVMCVFQSANQLFVLLLKCMRETDFKLIFNEKRKSRNDQLPKHEFKLISKNVILKNHFSSLFFF